MVPSARTNARVALNSTRALPAPAASPQDASAGGGTDDEKEDEEEDEDQADRLIEVDQEEDGGFWLIG